MSPATALSPEETPSAQEAEQEQPRYGEKNRQLPRQLQDAIASAIKKAQTEERYLRRLEVLHDAKNRFYERGHQHLYEGKNDCYMLAVPGAPFPTSDGEDEWDEYIDDYPVIHGFVWIIQSVLTQNGPGIKFEPKNPGASEDQQAAETADGIRRHFDRINDVKRIMREEVRMMCLSGRTVKWTRTEENAALWGVDDQGKPLRNQTATVYGCLETRVPILAKCQADFGFLGIYEDIDVLKAKYDYPWIRDQIRANEPNLEENQYERFARLGVLQGARSQYQASESITHLTTEGNWWLRPERFAGEEFDTPFEEASPDDMIEDTADDGTPTLRSPSVRDALTSTFADRYGNFTGIHAVYVGSTYAESWAESMDDCLHTFSPFIDDGQYSKAIMDPAIIAQDRLNDWLNYIAETFDFGAPSTWVYAQKAEWEAFANQKAMPYGLRQFKQMATATNALADNFFREPDPNVPATLSQAIEFFFGEFLQFVLASPPALWGESSADTKTASGLAQSRNQALGRMGIVWGVLQSSEARMYEQAALAAAADPSTPEQIIVPVEGSPNITVRVERLRKGHFRATPDEDSGFPDSTMAQRATLTQLLTMVAQFPPAAQQLLSAPRNWKVFLEKLGFGELIIPEAEAYDKQTAEIEELLLGTPIMPTPEEIATAQQEYQQKLVMASQMGVPPPPPFDPQSLVQSSVPIKPWDFDQWESEAGTDWLNSDACRIEMEIGRVPPGAPEGTDPVPNPRGVENVWLHVQEHQKAQAAKNPPMPQLPVVAPKGGGGKPGGSPPLAASQPAGSPGTSTI